MKGEHMIVLTGGRASGKTTALIRWVLERPDARCIFVLNAERQRYLIDRLLDAFPHWNYKDWQQHVLIYHNYFGGVISRGIIVPYPEVAFDDLDEILATMLRARVEIATLNATWIPLAPPTPEAIKVDSRIVPELESVEIIPVERTEKKLLTSGALTEVAKADPRWDIPPGSEPPRPTRGRYSKRD